MRVPAVCVRAGMVASKAAKVVVPPAPFWLRPPPETLTPLMDLVPVVIVLVSAGKVRA